MKKYSFHSINHHCEGEKGHFYNYHLSVQQAALSCCKSVNVYIPFKAHFFEEPPGWIRFFNPFNSRRKRRRFWRDLCRLFRKKEQDKRIFFLEFFGKKDFTLIALAAIFFAKKSDQFWVLYRLDFKGREKKSIQLFSKLLQWRLKDHFIPLTDSELLADIFSRWFGKRPLVMPIPHTFVSKEKKKQQKRLICYVGGGRQNQGREILSTLMTLPDPASKRFEFSLPGDFLFPPIENKLRVKLRKISTTKKEYQAAIDRCDIFLLPCDPIAYKRGTSGLFVEAVVSGKLPFVKEGSWLAHELRRFDLSELIIDWESHEIFSQLILLIEDKRVREKFKVMQSTYQNYHSEQNFSAIFQKLTNLIDSDSFHAAEIDGANPLVAR
ncbi:MAG: hypothetical protein S4CHLAM45_00850 [Chlamydiales bacterium]|nr:hypothetical protein [Chlamydiales bacterium]MCH9619406.1 hypothetical protein [Chlamydiales bacterium]MCH9622210.1 hypothetical protein [Chlamydiales bacterium]